MSAHACVHFTSFTVHAFWISLPIFWAEVSCAIRLQYKPNSAEPPNQQKWKQAFQAMSDRNEILIHCGDDELFYKAVIYGDWGPYLEYDTPAIGISCSLINSKLHRLYQETNESSGEPSKRPCIVLHAPLAVKAGALGAGYDLFTPYGRDRPKDKEGVEKAIREVATNVKVNDSQNGVRLEAPPKILPADAAANEVYDFLRHVHKTTKEGTYNEIYVVEVTREAVLGVVVHDPSRLEEAKRRLEEAVEAPFLDDVPAEQLKRQIRRPLLVGVKLPDRIEISGWIDPFESHTEPFAHLLKYHLPVSRKKALKRVLSTVVSMGRG